MTLMQIQFSDKIKVCTTATCVRTSMKLLDYIDSDIDPCEDFYLFSCGKFLRGNDQEKPGEQSTKVAAEKEIQVNIRNILEQPIYIEDRAAFQQAKKFYRTCMNETKIEEEGLAWIRSVFKRIGGWPSLKGNHWKEDQFNWQKAMHRLRKIGVNADLFFRVTVDKNRYNETQHILGIHGVAYSPPNIENKTRAMYLDYMVDVAQVFGIDGNIARKDSNEVIDLLLRLAKKYEESVERNRTGLYDLYSLSELQHMYPYISWKDYLSGILFPAESITDDDTIVVSEPLYLGALMRILKTSSSRTVANFIAWHTLQHLIHYLPAKLLDKAYDYLEKLYGEIVKEPRWMTCIQATRERMDSVVSAAYIENFFNENTKRDVEEMTANIKTQLKIVMKREYGLDDKVVENILNNMVDIGSNNDLMEIHWENQAYDVAKVDEDKLLQSVLNLDFISLNMTFGKLRKTVKENWLGQSSFVTGIYVYYSAKENVMRFPAGIFGGVYYHRDRPKYMNYGSVGSIMAKEMSHILMVDGPHSSGVSRSRSSMDFEIGNSNKRLDQKNAKDEAKADSIGMKIAYDSYSILVQQNGVEPRLPGLEYSPYQLFWISSAIRHCAKYSATTMNTSSADCQWSPPQFQVNGPLQNLDDFAKDFACPVGSGMNPEKKCFI
ncbi:neprilysin-2-like [Anoplophora glabripennis]|uniref:neprilysin-2-like n=1 Tax=Anoplophora glabripennis TaxID=217634 RepID=UPI0008758659|nr:neprilysin-2-like [Anoplophora glabripennis]